MTKRKILEFHITYICNHACIFCSEDTRMNLYNKYPLTEIQVRTILIDRAKKGFNYVHFTWGEPTLFPNFLSLLKFAKKLWYYTLIGTNGTKFQDKDYAKEVFSYLDQVILSVHWYDEETCSFQTGDTNHFNDFPKIIAGINENKKDSTYLMTNIVLNSHNYRNALQILKFLHKQAGYKLEHALYSIVAPEWLADTDYNKLVFDLDDFKQYIPELVDYCKKHNITLRFFGLPICFLWDKYSEYSNDLYWTERNTIERYTSANGKVVLQDIHSPDNSRKRTFTDTCDGCKWNMKPCTGIFKRYLEFYDF